VLELFNSVFNQLPPINRRRNPQIAALIGFLLGGIGLAIYFRSFVDFIVPVAMVVLLVAFSAGFSELGWFGGAILAGGYGYLRASRSNSSLESGRQPN
jgi:hypothetical protein